MLSVFFFFIKTHIRIFITSYQLPKFSLPTPGLHKVSPLRLRHDVTASVSVLFKANTCHRRPDKATVVLHIADDGQQELLDACTNMVRVTSVNWKSLDHR